MRMMTESDGKRRVRFRYLALIIAISLVAPVAVLLETGTVDWFWFVTGAVLNGVAVGPFARTATADRINRLGGAPASLQRFIVIVLMAICVWVTVTVLDPNTVTFSSFVGGGMAALLAVSAGRELRR